MTDMQKTTRGRLLVLIADDTKLMEAIPSAKTRIASEINTALDRLTSMLGFIGGNAPFSEALDTLARLQMHLSVLPECEQRIKARIQTHRQAITTNARNIGATEAAQRREGGSL